MVAQPMKTFVLAGSLSLSLALGGCAQRHVERNVSAEFPFAPHYVDVHGSRMHYVDEGRGDPILLLHGNPTSSYLWRNVIPHLAPHGRVIALDLIGMGRSDKPEIAYRVEDHRRYLEGFIEALDLHDLTLVVHDWGSALGFDYAARHEDEIEAIAFMEAITKPTSIEGIRPILRPFFKRMRHPKKGRRMVIDNNFFIEKILPAATLRTLGDAEMQAYRAPFIEPADRAPIWAFVREVPLHGEEGELAEVYAMMASYAKWLRSSPIPKLMLYAEPGALIEAEEVEEIMGSMSNLQAVYIGRGRHFIQESQPTRIGQALASWYVALPRQPE